MNYKTVLFIFISIMFSYGIETETPYQKRSKNDLLAELEVQRLDPMLNHAIPSPTSRICIRNLLKDAFARRYNEADEARNWKDEARNWKDEAQNWKDEARSWKYNCQAVTIECQPLQWQVKTLKTDLDTCTTSLKILSVRLWMEFVEKKIFPGWLQCSNMDRFEQWLFASQLVKGVNLDRVREIWNLGYNGQKFSYETMATATFELFDEISVQEANANIVELVKLENPDEIRKICKLAGGESHPERILVCEIMMNLDIDFSAAANGVGITEKYNVMYGLITKCKDNPGAIRTFKALFSNSTEPGDDGVQSCVVHVKLIIASLNPKRHRAPMNKCDFVGFNATCPKSVTEEEFNDYVMGVTGDEIGCIRNVKANENAEIQIFQDPYNIPD